MQNYANEKPSRPFSQGFWLGVVFGSLGALVILGRDPSLLQLLVEREASERAVNTISITGPVPTEGTVTTIPAREEPVIDAESLEDVPEPTAPIPVQRTPIAQG